MRRPRRRGLTVAELGLLYCAAIWGSTFYIVKDIVIAVNPFAMVAYRFLIAALLALPWVIARPNKARLVVPGLFLAALLTVLYVAQTEGLKYTSASNSGFITGLFIIFVYLFLLLFRRRAPAPGQWAAMGLALAGLYFLTGGFHDLNKGDAMTLLAALAYAGHLLATEHYIQAQADPILLSFHQFWLAGVLCLVSALLLGLPLAIASRRAVGVISFLALFPTLSAFYVQMLAQKTVPAARVSLFFLLEPVFAAIFAWTLGGETVRLMGALGGGLIVAAMLVGELAKPGQPICPSPHGEKI